MTLLADGIVLRELKVFVAAFVMNWSRYLFIGGTLYGLLYHTKLSKSGSLRDRRGCVRRGQIGREIYMSTISCAVLSLSAVGIHALKPYGMTKVYANPGEYGLLYLPFSLAIMIVAFDAYFYVTHRMLHVLGVRRTTHDQHHTSSYPTPWAALAFSPPEAFLIALFFVLITVAMPIQFNVYRTFLWIVFLQSAMHHSSHRIYPESWLRWPIFQFITVPHHHLLHHRYGAHNFGLYFTFWDRVMKTEHPRYRASCRELSEQSTEV